MKFKETYVVLLLLLHLIYINATNDVVVQNLKLFAQGKEYFIKAICYSPAPLGQGVNNGGTIGGGFCSPKLTPFGTITTTCYDSDYFDGGGDGVGRAQPVEGGWFQPVWRRDFPIMKATGANTLRIYNANPTTKQASIYFPEIVPVSVGKDHVTFMDMAQQYGFTVIFPLIGDYGMLTSYSYSAFTRLLRWQIDEVGGHPALLMWAFGNELPLNGNQQVVDLLNTYIAYIKQYTFIKWGRRIPVTTAVVDLPDSYDSLAANLDVDVFTTNAGYRGFTFTDLWSGNALTQGWFKLSCRYNKPVFIGEIGWQSLDNQITAQSPDWFNRIWQDLIGHMDQGAIGGAFFEYSDEILKDALQQTMGLVHFSVNSTGGQPSTGLDVWNVDAVATKDVYNAVRAGSYNGVFYNMNTDPFFLANRVQQTLGQSADICSSFALQTCPAANTCSYHGRCDRQVGTCTCNSGWTGSDCSQAVCTNGCSGQGVCMTTVSPPACSCQSGWTGPSCSVPATTSSCPTYCVSGNGVCDGTGKCVCYSGWVGHDCSIPNLNYPPVTGSTTAPTTPTPTITTPTPTITTPAPTTTTPAPTTTTTTTTFAPTTTTTTTPAPPTTTRAPSTTTAAPTTTTTTTTTTTNPPTTTRAPTTTTTTTTSAPTTTRAPTTTAPTTSTPTTTRAPTPTTTTPTTTTPTTTASVPSTTPTPTSTTPSPTSTTTTSSACAPLKSCGGACYDSATYSCFSGLLCPNPLQRCGMACYSLSSYTCVGNQLQAV